MAISIMGGVSGITVETDPSAVKLTGSTMSGELSLPQVGNLLNANLVVDSYNDTGAGTHYYHTFTPFDGKFNLATNGGGLTFPNGTTQITAGLPLTGGTLSGKVTCPASTTSFAPINLGVAGVAPTTPVPGDLWFGNFSLQHTDSSGINHVVATNRINNTFLVTQAIDSPSNATAPALRVTQRGTGHALVIEDSTNPDTSATFVSNAGIVYVGYNPASGVLPSSAAVNVIGGLNLEQGTSSHTNAFSLYNKEVTVFINNVAHAIPCRTI
jgi:hypothetical protein